MTTGLLAGELAARFPGRTRTDTTCHWLATLVDNANYLITTSDGTATISAATKEACISRSGEDESTAQSEHNNEGLFHLFPRE